MSSDFLTPEEVAAQLRVKEDTIRLWCRAGKLRATKVGKQWRITPDNLRAFLKTNIEEAQNEQEKLTA